VRFVIDPALPAGVKTVTLSYTFYKNDALTAALDANTRAASKGQADVARAAP
jgi:cytochrome c oxidase assembly protein subunit 11